jgi:DegV family protein with EDD domain
VIAESRPITVFMRLSPRLSDKLPAFRLQIGYNAPIHFVGTHGDFVMSGVQLITDSTAYIPKDLLNRYQIGVAPQVLIWDNQEFRDGVDIQPGEFYTRLKTAKVMPSTSQATPRFYVDLFRKGLDEYSSILVVTLSSKLSGTMASAIQAREQFPGAPIEIVDSETTAMAMGFIVLAAAEADAQGASLAECKSLAERARQNVGVFFTVDTLEFLHRGGRIGGASRLLGSALNIKPILELTDGRVEAIERVRTRSKSIDRMIELVEQRIGGRRPVRLAVLHANAEAEARSTLELANRRIGAVETIFSEVSPVVGTHAGPGTVGLAFMAGV